MITAISRAKIRPFTDQAQGFVQDFGIENVDPVDAFGGYVAVDKYASDNLDRTQDNLNWKVGLEPVGTFNKEVRK